MTDANVRARVVVYTTVYCGYCYAAKRLLGKKKVAYEEILCDDRPDLRDWLRTTTGQRTVPQVFVNDEVIGGYRELATLERQGLLDGRLSVAPPGVSTLRS